MTRIADRNGLDMDGLRQLYGSSETARLMLKIFAARERNATKTTVDGMLPLLARQGTLVDRPDVIATLKRLAELGCGRYIVARRGGKTRLEWSDDVSMIDVGRAASGGTNQVEPFAEPVQESPSLGRTESDLISYPFPLRDGLTVSFRLPRDLRVSEAERIAEFLKALAIPEQGKGAI